MSIKNPYEAEPCWKREANAFSKGVKAAVQYLEEPCDCLDHAQIVEFTINVKGMYPHRYLCPDCMANIKKELGI